MTKNSALIVGIVFLLLGALGIFPNSFVGVGSYFEVNICLNLIHLITGLILILVASKAPFQASLALKFFGVIYIIMAVAGFFVGEGYILGFISSSPANNWLHLALGLITVITGFSSRNSTVQ